MNVVLSRGILSIIFPSIANAKISAGCKPRFTSLCQLFSFNNLRSTYPISSRKNQSLTRRTFRVATSNMAMQHEVTETTVNHGTRCAIITGVSRPHGIGRCLVYNFLKQGYKVVGIDINELEHQASKVNSNLQTTHNMLTSDRFHFVQADISDPDKAKLAVMEAVEWFGGCMHLLINNAARTTTVLSNDDPIKDFSETIAINLNGAYCLSEYVFPYMPPQISSIIHISSTRALQSEPNTAAYSASKAGLCGLTHSQAITMAGKVRVNAVLPGWINTDPNGEAALRPEDHAWHPVGRVGVVQDIAEICLFLADEERSGFITGQQFVVDGGVSKKMVYPE
eukprot:TRINITY_DN11171_c0_g1_i1.p1 TRINITY_DN11171_c0_g1~~TRINITY_DN11171_c0_g1_i1.p1  ORF type:complete len:338 (-),score=51.96 TRINITY_DN11171_c0_g1_i1:27-1040(-)